MSRKQTTPADIPPDGWHIERVAQFLGVTKGTLYVWSHKDHPPIPRRVGRRLVYNPQDVIDYREQECRKTRADVLYTKREKERLGIR